MDLLSFSKVSLIENLEKNSVIYTLFISANLYTHIYKYYYKYVH